MQKKHCKHVLMNDIVERVESRWIILVSHLKYDTRIDKVNARVITVHETVGAMHEAAFYNTKEQAEQILARIIRREKVAASAIMKSYFHIVMVEIKATTKYSKTITLDPITLETQEGPGKTSAVQAADEKIP